MNKTQNTLAAILALSAFGAAANAQRPYEVVKWNATVTKSTATSASVALTATIQEGWHVYALSQPPGGPTPLRITIPATAPFTLQTPVAESKVIRHEDPTFKMETVYYLNTINLTVDLKKQGSTPTETVPVDVRYQACNDRLCLPPYTAHLTAAIKQN
ncbi:disulfide bond corrector protein DsbC [Terriglobus roseus DSM 18391]|uniref:Disulfide bond corrector protein DsbC n=1 Tax=Terriglobus roseus (strain DSM 18391 / NRRL B-41598 / KBS 63) TaxID=926566 RepID=I3ZMJ8_TERRK|nr:protein-disulfide reductase DsbD N-terminal domain-containing protein [Terriglobus roseus]AFL90466.1 disulfide bond corrector protein DsbC [Terriglobus roseus DSM 18391]